MDGRVRLLVSDPVAELRLFDRILDMTRTHIAGC
ncbi:hypothetical protein ENSA5_55040 [Enhygromyxa salina]|uniref:Uncharacterized protein n=1 Tax=Enhygromyxa salina TaxID=215803 RepID=A0A2S9XEW6_9BACT|nr:hypothetical protein ENSA5_55040 [Enhygromyxa salina]